MNDQYVYGLIVNDTFISNRMEWKLGTHTPNGIYSMNMEVDDFRETIEPADIIEAANYFKKSNKAEFIRGVSFHDGIVPENPVKFGKVPIKLIDSTADEFDFIEVLQLKVRNGYLFYFMQVLDVPQSYVLFDLKERFDNKIDNIDDIQHVTPEMKIVYSFQLLERHQKLMEEPVNAIKSIMATMGVQVLNVVKRGASFEVIWELSGHRINTLLDKKFQVVEAGFCVSGYDKTQSIRSVTNVLKDYVRDGDYIHITRVSR